MPATTPMPTTSARRRLLLALPLAMSMLSLAACAPKQETVSEAAPAASASSENVPAPAETAPPATPGDMAAQCNAGAAQSFVGKDATDTNVGGAKGAAGAKGDVRVIKPGQAVTMDYRGDRLNVEVDDHDAIVRITCG
jgi:peptidase inhibitor I78 family protein